MKKLGLVMLFLIVGSACFVTGLFVGLDQKEIMKQSFRTALHQAQTHLKLLQLQSQPDAAEALQKMAQHALEVNLQSMVLMYMAGNEIDTSSFQSTQILIKEVNDYALQQNWTLFSDEKHWQFPETVRYIQSNLENMAKGEPADISALE